MYKLLLIGVFLGVASALDVQRIVRALCEEGADPANVGNILTEELAAAGLTALNQVDLNGVTITTASGAQNDDLSNLLQNLVQDLINDGYVPGQQQTISETSAEEISALCAGFNG